MPLTRADAFLIPLLAGEVGIPMAGTHFLNALGAAEGALGDRAARYRDAYRQSGAAVGAQVVDVEARLVRSGLAPPPRPDSYALYVRWSDEAVRLVADATGPMVPEGVLGALGRVVGELMQTVATHTAVLDLREVAPHHPMLLAYHEQLAARTATHVERLPKIAQLPAFPPELAPHAARLAAQGRVVAMLNRKTELGTQAAGLRLAFGQLGTTIRAVRALVEA